MDWLRVFRRRIPFIPQMEAVECGSASLTMVLSYYGLHAPLAEVRQACGVGRDGSNAAAILKAAQDYGLEAEAFKADVHELYELLLPAILHWEFRHFLVLERINKRCAVLVDPAQGRITVSIETLRKAYTGVALAFRPEDHFVKRARKRPSLHRYTDLIKQHLPSLVQLFMASIFLQIVGIVMPMSQKILVDRVIVPKQEAWLWGLAVALIMAFLIQSALSYLRSWVIQTLQVAMDIKLVGGYMNHMLKLPLSFFLQRRSGDLIQRMDSNAVIQSPFSERTVSAVLDVFLLTGYAALMIAFNSRLAFLVMGLGSLRLLFQIAVQRVNQMIMSAELAAAGGASAVLFESLSSLETIKAAGAEGAFVRRWADRQIARVNSGLRREYLNLNLGTLMGLANSLGTTAVFLFAGKEVLDQQMTIGTFSAFLSLQGLFLAPLGSLLAAYEQIQYMGSHLARLDDVMETQAEPKGTKDPKNLKGIITLEQVSFSYTSTNQAAVEDISLEIKAGEKIALIGPTGAGKSTLARLLLGMHIPTRGVISFDGVDLREFNLSKLRNRMGVVLQETFLLNDTVQANLCLNDPDIPLKQMKEATRIACIDEVIEALPKGYDSVIGENGRTLSGGQRQRLSLARALAHNPSILLLDEATSSLDLETEAKVHKNLSSYGCTRILIAHRLATVLDADRIIVMDQGRIVQMGTYEALRNSQGLFRTMADSAEATHA